MNLFSTRLHGMALRCGLAATCGLMAIVAATTTAHAQQNIVVNGGFEIPVITGANTTVSSGSSALTGWTITGTSGVDLVRTLWQPGAGSQSISLNWTSPSTLAQTVSTTPGACYTLSYLIAAETPAGSSTIRTLRARWNGVVVSDVQFNPAGHTNASMGWRAESVLVAGHGTDELRFESTTPANYGPALDGVQVSLALAIASNPSSQTTCATGTATFSVTASGTGPFSYQWQRETPPLSGSFFDIIDGPTGTGSIIAGATTVALQITTVSSADATRYRCFVSNACGNAISNPATLTVFPGGSGDGDGNGTTDGLDIQWLADILVSGGTPSASYCAYDMNADGAVDMADVPLFISLLLI